tara:strand:+ start:281 stop:778 length:498 start_codon:yes stop_codon:yes gene_type:complete
MNSIDSCKNELGEIEKENIKKIIPYEDSFLYIDKVTQLDKKKITATKDVRNDEYWVKGHFANFPIMPGALIVEGLGQAATMLVRYNIENHEQKEVLAYKIRSAKFFRPTFPGHKLRFEVKLKFKFKMAWFVSGIAYRGEKEVSKVKMVLAVVDRDKFRRRYAGKK